MLPLHAVLVAAQSQGTVPPAAAGKPESFQFREVEGAFGGPTLWTEAVRCADIENDGDLDVFLARGEGWDQPGRKHQAGLLVNKLEERAFLFADESLQRLGYLEAHGKDVVTADITGDALVDALFVNAFNDAPPYLMVNRGEKKAGYFRLESDERGLSEALNSCSAAFGDVDDDGDLDLVLTDAGPSLLGPPGGKPRLYVNDGDGRFAEDASRLPAADKVGHMGVHLADLDGDFDLDLFGPNRTGESGTGHYLFANDGEGRFTDRSELLPATTGGVYEAEVGDLDGDRDIDLFFTSLTKIEGAPGRFPLGEGPARSLVSDAGELRFEKGVALGVDDDNELVLLDVDQDADLDAIIGSLGPREKLLRNGGGLAFALDDTLIQPIADPSLDIAVADLDDDGAPDLVTAQGLERIGAEQPPCRVYKNHGPADQQPPRILYEEVPASPASAEGPWVVHATVQDDAVDDGETWVSGDVLYTLLPEFKPVDVAVGASSGGDEPIALHCGGAVRMRNATPRPIRLRGRELAAGADSAMLAPGATWVQLLVRPGVHEYVAQGLETPVRVEVTGEPLRSRALVAGTGFFRFLMTPPPVAVAAGAKSLAYQLVFTDRAGNATWGAARRIGLEPDAPPEEPRPDGLVTRTDAAFAGWTLFSPLNSRMTRLVDMEGNVVHSWKTEHSPGGATELLPNGNLLFCARQDNNPRFRGGGIAGRIVALDWDANVVWDYELANDRQTSHHDFELMPNGNVLVIAWEHRTREEALARGRDPEQLNEGGLWPDCVLEIKPTLPSGGEVVWEWHAWDHLIQDVDPALEGYGQVAEHPELIDINADHRDDPPMTPERQKKQDELLKQMAAVGYAGGADGADATGGGADGTGDADGAQDVGTAAAGVPPPPAPPAARDKPGDWLHTNAVAYHVRADLIVLSTPTMSELWVIDHTTTTAEAAGHAGGRHGRGGDLLWRWGNPKNYGMGEASDRKLFAQHDPQWTVGAVPGELRLTVFNNGRERPEQEFSSVDELLLPFDPIAGFSREPGQPFGPAEPDWSYSDPERFFSSFISGAQRLPNGNTLVCEGAKGRVFEVTRDGTVVWDYWNPHGGDVPPSDQGGRAPPKALFRATRIPRGHPALAARIPVTGG